MRLTRVKIASRKSDLARLQAYLVGQALKNKNPDLEIEFQFKESLGDKNLTDPLWKMPEKGVFTEDFHQDLLSGYSDMVVHSWKDLPVEGKPETEIVATLDRADVRDLLLFKKSSLAKLSSHQPLKIYSSSPRRSYNLIPFLKDHLPYQNQSVSFEPVRGNIQTRVRKMLESTEIDGLILAKAAMDRLLVAQLPSFAPKSDAGFQTTASFLAEALDQCSWMVLPLSKNPAAAAQGALAVEILKSRDDLKSLLAEINNSQEMKCINGERQRLASYGGGCHQKIGVSYLSRSFGEIEFLRGLTDAGVVLDSKTNTQSLKPKSALMIENSEEHFSKENLKVTLPQNINALFVSHSSALTEDIKPQANINVLWTAGLSTWQSLAEKGFWVNGSSESLGENEDLRISALTKGTALNWGKLAHSDAASSSDKALIATYRLKKRPDRKFTDKADAYYWKSASLFRSALELAPKLIEKQHYCGPGHSFDEIKKLCPHVQVLWPSPDARMS